ncbi:MAG: MFS transporter, partial [Chitinophagaceae bacterium]|nr:MFS transporter [Chitinophagaceae bacterium]
MTSIINSISSPVKNRAFVNPLIIVGTLFFIFGFVTWLSSVLIPYLQIACELNNFQSYLVAFAFYISYFIAGIPSGWLLKLTGFKNGLSLGLLLVALGSLLFIPAAIYRLYPVFLLGLFIQGAGLTILQTASNPYVAILGPKESAARRISFMGICNGIAGVIAPIILGAVILSDADALQKKLSTLTAAEKILALNELAGKVIFPYIIITLVLVALSVLVYFSSLPEVDEEETAPELVKGAQEEKTSIFQFPHLLLGVLILFLYTGVEVIAGNSIIGYGAYFGIPLSTSKFFTAFTLVGMLIGYIIGIICIPRYFSQESALKGSAILGVICTVAAILT